MNKQIEIKPEKKIEKATFAAGCFWGIEGAFANIKGILFAQVGYSGGKKENPTYKQVSSGKTGHAESIEIEFNSERISYEELLKIFWESHDPTTKNKQGADKGSNYRSIIFYHTPEQKKIAQKSKKELEKSKKFENPIVTEIIPSGKFWRAEEYHQGYYRKHG